MTDADEKNAESQKPPESPGSSDSSEEMEKRDGKVVITLHSSNMIAKMRVALPEGGGKPMEHQDALNALLEAGVKHGVNDALIQDIFMLELFNEAHTIADGEAAVDGIDGSLKYHIDLNPRVAPKEDAKGNVDYRNVNVIIMVEEGGKLVEEIPPTEGIPGHDVLDQELPGKGGRPANLPQGTNTKRHPDNPNLLIASIAGSVVQRDRGTVLEVQKEYVVAEHVDFHTGNIDYIGSVIIKGDVKSGFSVKAGGDIEVHGVVEDATLEAVGKVMIQKGLIGSGKGKVTAGDDVYLKFCENQTIITKKSVYAGQSIRHSEVHAEKKVIVSGQKGAIVGGRIFAVEGVEAKTIGNYQYTQTDILVGINEEAQRKLEETRKELEQIQENEEKIKEAIYNLIKSSPKRMSPQRTVMMKKLQVAKSQLPGRIKELEEDTDHLIKELSKHEGATVKAITIIYPNVRIQITNRKTRVNDEQQFVQYELDGVDVVARKYTKD